MKSTKLKLLVLAAAIIATGNLALAQRGDGPRQQRHHMSSDGQGMRWERMAEHLDLTDAQQEQIKTLRLSFQEETLPLKNELREKKARMQTLTTAKDANMKGINQLADEMGALRTNLMKKHLAHQQEVRKVLTDEQRIIFDSHHHKRHGRMRRG